MPKTTFEIQQNPTPTEEMPWVFQILMESDDIHPREILAVDEGKMKESDLITSIIPELITGGAFDGATIKQVFPAWQNLSPP